MYDGLGSVVGEVDVAGVMASGKKHDVYGLRRDTTGTQKSKHGFVGGLGHYSDDETGLVYMRGRFISEDVKGDGINWYIYCGNDPINAIDRSGQSSELLSDMSQWAVEHVSTIAWAIGMAFVFAAIRQMMQYKKLQETHLPGAPALMGALGSASALAGAGSAWIGIAAVGMMNDQVWGYITGGILAAQATLAVMVKSSEAGTRFGATTAVMASFVYGCTVMGFAASVGADIL